MLRPRIIPCLLIHNDGLVKTVRFKDAKYVGDPINAVKIFNEKQADELVVLNIDATTQIKEPDFKLIAQIAVECRMPLCYGGGIKNVEQARRIIALGVEKVAISSAAVEDPTLVTAISNEVGRQSVVVVLDVKRDSAGSSRVWSHNGQRSKGRSAIELAKQVEALGAGEIVFNSIDNDGRMEGYDLALAEELRRSVRVPITMLGGAGSLSDVAQLIRRCGVVGAAAGSLFVFKGAYRAVLINYPNPDQKEELIRSALRSDQ